MCCTHSLKKAAGVWMWSMTFLACHPAVTQITFGKRKVSVGSLLRGLMMPKALTKPTRTLFFFCSFRIHIWFCCHSWQKQDQGLKTASQFSCLISYFVKCMTLFYPNILCLYTQNLFNVCLLQKRDPTSAAPPHVSSFFFSCLLGEFFLTRTEGVRIEGVVCCTDCEALSD